MWGTLSIPLYTMEANSVGYTLYPPLHGGSKQCGADSLLNIDALIDDINQLRVVLTWSSGHTQTNLLYKHCDYSCEKMSSCTDWVVWE